MNVDESHVPHSVASASLRRFSWSSRAFSPLNILRHCMHVNTFDVVAKIEFDDVVGVAVVVAAVVVTVVDID